MNRMIAFPHLARTALGVALAVGGAAWMPPATAQSTPVSAASTADAHAMDMGAMPMGDMLMPASSSSTRAPASDAIPAMEIGRAHV